MGVLLLWDARRVLGPRLSSPSETHRLERARILPAGVPWTCNLDHTRKARTAHFNSTEPETRLTNPRPSTLKGRRRGRAADVHRTDPP